MIYNMFLYSSMKSSVYLPLWYHPPLSSLSHRAIGLSPQVAGHLFGRLAKRLVNRLWPNEAGPGNSFQNGDRMRFWLGIP